MGTGASRWILALLATIACGVIALPSAVAAEIRASFSPAEVSGVPPWRASYRVELTTGDVEERYEVSPPTASPRLEGLGTLEYETFAHADPVAFLFCAGEPGAFLHAPVGAIPFDTYILTLPPNTTSALVVDKTIWHYPWPRDDLSYAMSLRPINADGTRGDFQELRFDGPRLNVLRGVEIKFNRPYGPRHQAAGSRNAVPLIGRTSPPIPGQLLELRVFYLPAPASEWPADSRSRRLAVVRVRAGGSFSYRGWRPSEPGRYLVYALYRPQADGFAKDRSQCPVVVQIPERT